MLAVVMNDEEKFTIAARARNEAMRWDRLNETAIADQWWELARRIRD